MIQEFREFGEASRLYAQYASVVDQMYEAFKSDILAFLDAVQKQLSAELAPLGLMEEAKSTYRCWWIADEKTKDNENPPYVYVRPLDPGIIHPGLLTVTARMEEADDADRMLIASAHTTLNLQNCEITKAGGFFTVLIPLDHNDPVSSVTRPLAAVLKALHDVENKLQQKAQSATKNVKR